jgi:hypothetical protein
MPAFFDACRSSVIDFFLTPIVGTEAHAEEMPRLAKEHGITSFKLHLQMQGSWKRTWPNYAFDDGTVYSVFETVATGLRRSRCSTARTGKSPGSWRTGSRPLAARIWGHGTTVHRG